MTGRSGAVILIAGPDGVGKSTLADGLAAGRPDGRRVVRVHQRPRLLPRRTVHEGPVREPHAQRPYPTWLSGLKVLYLYLDVVLGWFVRLRPIARRGDLVLLERGWWDLVVDPRRYRLGGVGGLSRRLGQVMPQPDLVLILEAPPGLIHGRVPELPEAELARQVAAWHEVLPPDVARVILDATRPPAVVRDQAIAAISTRLESGATRRLG